MKEEDAKGFLTGPLFSVPIVLDNQTLFFIQAIVHLDGSVWRGWFMLKSYCF